MGAKEVHIMLNYLVKFIQKHTLMNYFKIFNHFETLLLGEIFKTKLNGGRVSVGWLDEFRFVTM